MRERPSEHVLVGAPPRRHGAAFVEAPRAVRQPCDERVDDDVSRSRVKGGDVVARPALRKERHVPDSADVLDRASPRAVAEDDPVAEGHERRAFAAGGEVGAAEIGDDGHAKRLRDPRRVDELQRRALGGEVRDRLSVRRDRGDRVALEPRGAGAGECGLGVCLADAGAQLRDVRGGERLALARGEDPRAQRLGVVLMHVREEAHLRSWPFAPDLGRDGVDAVGRRAGHQADDDHESRLTRP